MPYIVTAYTGSARPTAATGGTGFVAAAQPGRRLLFQYGIANYLNIKPVSGTLHGWSDSDERPERRHARRDRRRRWCC